jgi:hypothetical protein
MEIESRWITRGAQHLWEEVFLSAPILFLTRGKQFGTAISVNLTVGAPDFQSMERVLSSRAAKCNLEIPGLSLGPLSPLARRALRERD